MVTASLVRVKKLACISHERVMSNKKTISG